MLVQRVCSGGKQADGGDQEKDCAHDVHDAARPQMPSDLVKLRIVSGFLDHNLTPLAGHGDVAWSISFEVIVHVHLRSGGHGIDRDLLGFRREEGTSVRCQQQKWDVKPGLTQNDTFLWRSGGFDDE
jgi:hypothetical protein